MAIDRDVIYDWLYREFQLINARLDAEGQVELDGKLWKLAGDLADGKISALQSRR